jgi:hypothetical protein
MCEDCRKEKTSREKIAEIREILADVCVYEDDEIKEEIDHIELCQIYEDLTELNKRLTKIIELVKEEPTAAGDGSEISDEEAIEIVKTAFETWENEYGTGDWSKEYKARDMAIQALKKESCEDCISRKTLIERINHAEENFKADNMESIGSDDGDPFVNGVLSGVFNIREMVIQAPSVTPQEPKTMVEIDLYSVIKQKYIGRVVLDKIRAEIEKETDRDDHADDYWDGYFDGMRKALTIIDKYKAESEDKENE